MRILVDTNVLSELVRPRPEPSVLAWVRTVHHPFVSVVTVEELAYGLSRRPNPRVADQVDALLATCTELPVTSDIARACGRLRGSLATRGITRTQADLLIAATASLHGLPVATRNTRDFADCGVEVIDPFA